MKKGIISTKRDRRFVDRTLPIIAVSITAVLVLAVGVLSAMKRNERERSAALERTAAVNETTAAFPS